MLKIDATGLSCPQPVLLTQKGLAGSPDGVEVCVDNQTAVQNITRFAQSAGYTVQVAEAAGLFTLAIGK